MRWGTPDSGGDVCRMENRYDGLYDAGKPPKCSALSEHPKC